jgi:hypothetical protein
MTFLYVNEMGVIDKVFCDSESIEHFNDMEFVLHTWQHTPQQYEKETEN